MTSRRCEVKGGRADRQVSLASGNTGRTPSSDIAGDATCPSKAGVGLVKEPGNAQTEVLLVLAGGAESCSPQGGIWGSVEVGGDGV